ncbi:MAG: serine/threonine-protein kinase, partial [Myxococcota bacterium]
MASNEATGRGGGDRASRSQADPAATRASSLRIPGYRNEGVLGIGGFGTVLACRRESDGFPVAVKTVHRDDIIARARLIFEARALAQIGPPHVPALYAQGQLPDGRPYFVFERLTLSRSLDRRLGRPMTAEVVRALAMPILDAIAAAHQCGIIHRDIKPDNIFVGDLPATAKLIDFGLARPLDLSDRAMEATATGILLGTPTYMSPEQCRGNRPIVAATDIYAMGVVLYEMLGGQPPFSGDAALVRIAHIGRRPPSLAARVAIAPELDAVVLRCLAKEPEDRYQSIAELRPALDHALGCPAPAPSPRSIGAKISASGNADVL